MYHLIRRIHLFSGLSLLIFVLMYFFTGYVMVHERWFGEGQPVVAQRKESLAIPGSLSDDAASQFLQERFGLAGKRMPPTRKKDGSWQFTYNRPGTAFEAVISPDGQTVAITEKKLVFGRLMNGLHRQRGYGGGRIYDVWSFVYDLASAVLLVFAVSGAILWWKSTRKRWPGWICLGISSGFTVSMIVYLGLRK